MRSRFVIVAGFVLGLLFLWNAAGFCAEGDGKVTQEQWKNKMMERWGKDKGGSELIDIGQNGIIDYEKGYIEAIGLAAANLRFKDNPGQARLACLRAAEVLAYRAILETTTSVQINSETTVKDMMTESDIVNVKSQGTLKGVQTVPNSEEYFSDLSCAVRVRMPLAKAVQAIGAITKKEKKIEAEINKPSNVPPPKVKAVPAQEAGGEVYTGLVIDARGQGARPAMAPKIVDENGAEVYGSAMVDRNFAVQQGMSGYARDLGAAQSNQRVTNNPITMKALSVEGGSKADLRISNADAEKLRSVSENLSFMKKCRVMIVLD